MKRRKKAWNMSNPLYRYLHSSKSARKKKRRISRGVIMAKRRRSSRRSSRFGGGIISKGLFPTHGFINQALAGAGAATLQEKVVPQVIPYQGVAAGFVVGGAAGAAGAFIRDIMKGMGTGQVMANAYSY